MISNTNNKSGQSETLAQVSLSKESDFTKYIDFQCKYINHHYGLNKDFSKYINCVYFFFLGQK